MLNIAAQTDQVLKRTVDFYVKAINEISCIAAAFFKSTRRSDAAIDTEFAKALGRVFPTISKRVQNEEQTLHAAYEIA